MLLATDWSSLLWSPYSYYVAGPILVFLKLVFGMVDLTAHNSDM
jgi:hypothetical protein